VRFVAKKSNLDDTCESPPQVVGARGRRRYVLQRIGERGESTLPEKMEGELSASTASRLVGLQYVDLCILPVPDVVNERDLGPHEVKIAVIAVKVNAKLGRRLSRGWRMRYSILLRPEGRGEKKGSGDYECAKRRHWHRHAM